MKSYEYHLKGIFSCATATWAESGSDIEKALKRRDVFVQPAIERISICNCNDRSPPTVIKSAALDHPAARCVQYVVNLRVEHRSRALHSAISQSADQPVTTKPYSSNIWSSSVSRLRHIALILHGVFSGCPGIAINLDN